MTVLQASWAGYLIKCWVFNCWLFNTKIDLVFPLVIKGEHLCKTICNGVKEQPEIIHFARKNITKSFSMSTFKPPKVEQKLYSLLLYPAGFNSFFLLHPAGGNSLLLLYPAGGNSLVLFSLAGKQLVLTYFYRKETNNNGKYKYKFVSSL